MSQSVIYLDHLKTILPEKWSANVYGIWLVVNPLATPIPDQGWKLHISSKTSEAIEVLDLVLPVLFKHSVNFKIAKDDKTHSSINGKNWPRSGSGKFITIYPENSNKFEKTANELALKLEDRCGPYILTDRRWPNSRCLFYRYGGFRRLPLVNSDGTNTLCIIDPNGKWVPDLRTPSWHLPSWVDDPHEAYHKEQSTKNSGFNSRYQIDSAITFSSRGGVYRALDLQSNTKVVVKEARPWIEIGNERKNATECLEHEWNVLVSLSKSPYFVKPIDIFDSWEHKYIALEHVSGDTLGKYSVRYNPLYFGRLTKSRLIKYLLRIIPIWLDILDAIKFAHDKGIVLGDISLNNIMVSKTGEISIIDVEGAFYIEDASSYIGIVTPGFFKKNTEYADKKDMDWYAFGAIMLGTLFIANGIVHLQPKALSRYCKELSRDTGIPDEIFDIIMGCYNLEVVSHKKIKKLLTCALISARDDKLETGELCISRKRARNYFPDAATRNQIEETIFKAVSHIKGTYKQDREPAWEADLLAEDTNSFAVSYGISGICYAMHRLGFDGRKIFNDRLPTALEHQLTNGLNVGYAGMSWVGLELGSSKLAIDFYNKAISGLKHNTDNGLYFGSAGLGMLALKFWKTTNNYKYFEHAKLIGENIKSSSLNSGDEVFWTNDYDDHIPVGYGKGASGISMFLFYLGLASNQISWIELGKRALDHDLKTAHWEHGGFIGFPEFIDTQGKSIGAPSCYLSYGTSGIIRPLLHYHSLLGAEEYERKLKQYTVDIERKYTSFPQMGKGLAGIGNSLLDLFSYNQDMSLLKAAYEVARSIIITGIETEHGVTFPGTQAKRPSSDYLTGIAGIVLFLNRLLMIKDNLKNSDNFDFMLNDYWRPDEIRKNRKEILSRF